MSLKMVELFAGSRTLSRLGKRMGFETFSVDIEAFDGIDYVGDVNNLTTKDLPFIPDVVWASFDCTTYSIAAISTHRRKDKETGLFYPKSEYAKVCDITNQYVISLINEWLVINPDMVFFIENPRGALRHMEFMEPFKRHTVWYCQYGDDRAKPTDIWTNSTDWDPRPVCRNFKYDYDGEVINRHCHHQSAQRGAKTGTQGRKNSYERSKIPKELCIDILLSIKLKNFTIPKGFK